MDQDSSDYEEVVLVVSMPTLSGTGLLASADSVTISCGSDNRSLTCSLNGTGLTFQGDSDISLGSQLILEKSSSISDISAKAASGSGSSNNTTTRIVALTNMRADLTAIQYAPATTMASTSSSPSISPVAANATNVNNSRSGRNNNGIATTSDSSSSKSMTDRS